MNYKCVCACVCVLLTPTSAFQLTRLAPDGKGGNRHIKNHWNESTPPFPQSCVLLRFLSFDTYDRGHFVYNPVDQIILFACLVGWFDFGKGNWAFLEVSEKE